MLLLKRVWVLGQVNKMQSAPPSKFGPYSPVRQASSFYFVSGQVGVKDGKTTPGDVSAQTRQALQNLKSVLDSMNLASHDVVKITVFLKNMSDFAAFNEVYIDYFPEPRPARSCVAVAALPNIADAELLVEIEAVAYKENAQ